MQNSIIDIIKELVSYPNEEEWFEFKENWYHADGIGEYISSLSNAAAMKGRPFGYLIWGVSNDSHEYTDTTFDYHKDVDNEPLEHYLARYVTPDVNFVFKEDKINDKRVVVLVIPAAHTIPTAYKNVRYLRIGSSKVNLIKYPDEVLNVPQADERNRIVERKEIMLFDIDAFREAIINSFVHNLWVTGNEPMFAVYEDRIEILSRGTLAPGQTIDGFFAGESVPVNTKLSEIFLQLHISEKSGRGVPKIIEIYGKEAFEFRQNSIVVTIPFNRLDLGSVTQVATQVANQVTAPVRAVLEPDEISKKILMFCTEAKSTKEITNYLGFKERKSTSRYLKNLLQGGRLAMTIPDKPNSSKQKYITIK